MCCAIVDMASRHVFTVVEVLNALEDSDSGSESEDEFDGYIDEDDYEERRQRLLEEYECSEEESREDENEGSESEGRESEGGENEGSGEAMDTGGASRASILTYSHQPGCKATLRGNDPIDYFSLFFDDALLQHIVQQTKLNYEQYVESHVLGPRSRVRQWEKQEHQSMS